MVLSEQNVLLFVRTMGMGGTESVVLQLCEILLPLVNRIVVCSCGGVNVEKLQQMGIRHYLIPDIQSKNPKTVIAVSRELRRIVSQEHITVVHTHNRMAAFYVYLLGIFKHCYFFNTCHNTFTDKRLLTRIAYRKCDLIACGEVVKRNLIEFYGLNNITVIHNAIKPFDGPVNVDQTLAEAKKGGGFLIGNIGRLSVQKGMAYFIQSVTKVVEQYPNARFYIIGSGDEEANLRQMSKDVPVSFLGYRRDVQNIICQLDLVVLSSLWEGLPLTPIEAFSVGKTVVATDVDGTPEIVKDMENGLLVEPKSPDALAAGICWMMEHPKERRQMELKARETFDKGFSFEAFACSYADFYRSR